MNNETIICVSSRRWDSLWRSTQHIISRLALQNRVIYFEPGRNPDKSILSEFFRNLPYYFQIHVKEVQKNLFVVPSPSTFPRGGRYLPPLVLKVWIHLQIKINATILIRHIKRVMRSLGIKSPILWLYDPANFELVGKFGEKLSCFYNYDEEAEFAPNARIKSLLEEIDHQMVKRVNVVFASSNIQATRRKAINPNTYFVPNAVDFRLFNLAVQENLPIPADIRSLPHPIIGFAGWMGYQIDVPLLLLLAGSFSNGSLVLIGPDRLPDSIDRQKLSAMKNVFFLGQKKMEELPLYLRWFDVALLPYLLTGHMLYAYPLKLHEYLAAGKATVATSLPELRPFNHVVRIAETHDQFVNFVQDSLVDHSPDAIESRIAVARENTWDHRVARIYEHLEYHLSSVH